VTITADSRTDVNAAFAAERMAQVGRVERLMSEEGQREYIAEQTARFEARVAAGELVKLGEGRYQSTQGWDRGEVWEVRSVNGQSLVLPQHGLDMMEGGKARLYSAVPAWHGLGQVIPGGITSIDDVIRLGGLNVPAVSVPVPDYTVPGLVDSEGNPRTFKAPGKFIVSNGLTGEFWGVVGKVHKNIDVRVSFEFLEKLLGQLGINWEAAGLMGNGRQVFISCKVPAGLTIDADGINDHVELFIVIQDTRDGSGSYRVMITPWRPLCQNTNRFAFRDALSMINLRHTVGLPGQLEKVRKVLGLTVEYSKTFEAEETALARAKTNTREFEQLMAELSAEGKKDDDLSGRVFGARDRAEEGKRTELANNRAEDDLMARWAVEKDRVGETLYAAEQAYTGRLDWGRLVKGDGKAAAWQNRIEASLNGETDQAKTRAHARLMQLVGGGTERK
jgi:phage/plasmid-like protein (TIGR03299 family)